MATAIRKKKIKTKKVFKKNAVKYDDLPDLDKDPYFIKKAEEAKEMLRESGIIFDN